VISHSHITISLEHRYLQVITGFYELFFYKIPPHCETGWKSWGWTRPDPCWSSHNASNP